MSSPRRDRSTDDILASEIEYHDHDNPERLERVSRFYSDDLVGPMHRRFKAGILSGVAGKRVLEYGCGAGSFASDLARAGADVTGIDISAHRLQQAREQAAASNLDITFLEMDAQALTFPDDSFDRIVGGAIIHHLDPDRAFGEVARTLRPGGDAWFIEPLGYNPAINWFRNRTPTMRTPDEHPLVKRDIAMAEAHFGSVDVRQYLLAELLGAFVGGTGAGRVIRPPLRLLDAALLRLPAVRWLAWSCIIHLAQPRKRPGAVTPPAA